MAQWSQWSNRRDAIARQRAVTAAQLSGCGTVLGTFRARHRLTTANSALLGTGHVELSFLLAFWFGDVISRRLVGTDDFPESAVGFGLVFAMSMAVSTPVSKRLGRFWLVGGERRPVIAAQPIVFASRRTWKTFKGDTTSFAITYVNEEAIATIASSEVEHQGVRINLGVLDGDRTQLLHECSKSPAIKSSAHQRVDWTGRPYRELFPKADRDDSTLDVDERRFIERWEHDVTRLFDASVGILAVLPATSRVPADRNQWLTSRFAVVPVIAAAILSAAAVVLLGFSDLSSLTVLYSAVGTGFLCAMALNRLNGRIGQVAVVFTGNGVALVARPWWLPSRRRWPQLHAAAGPVRVKESFGTVSIGVRNKDITKSGAWITVGQLTQPQRDVVVRWNASFESLDETLRSPATAVPQGCQ
jgi:hypothetical protein